MKKILSRRMTWWAVLILALLSFAYRTSVFRISKNFYEVDPGKFYRSAQLTSEELQEVIDQYKIKTVISLRGANPKAFWYPPEIETVEKNHIKFLSFGFATEYYPQPEDLRGYLKALKEEDYPILVHCKTGADRTGEATALYMMEIKGVPKEQAIQDHLNFKYWHVNLFQPSKISFMKKYQGYDWAMSTYDDCTSEFADHRNPDSKCL